MLTQRKSHLGSFGFGAVALLSAALFSTYFTGPLGQSIASSAASTSLMQPAVARVHSAFGGASAAVPDDVKSFPQRASAFLSRNATAAQLQLEGMKNSLSAHANLSAWFGHSAPNWIQRGADVATQAAGNKPRVMARKVPVVNAAMNVAQERVNAVTASLASTARGF